jgi:hypothetical protein
MNSEDLGGKKLTSEGVLLPTLLVDMVVVAEATL